MNNGTLHYDHDRDGTHAQVSGCTVSVAWAGLALQYCVVIHCCSVTSGTPDMILTSWSLTSTDKLWWVLS